MASVSLLSLKRKSPIHLWGNLAPNSNTNTNNSIISILVIILSKKI